MKMITRMALMPEEAKSFWKTAKGEKTNREFAKECGIAQQTYANMVSGKQSTTAKILQRIQDHSADKTASMAVLDKAADRIAAAGKTEISPKTAKKPEAPSKAKKLEEPEKKSMENPHLVSLGIFLELAGTEIDAEAVTWYLQHFAPEPIRSRTKLSRANILYIDPAVAVFLSTELLHLDALKIFEIVTEIENRNSEVPELQKKLEKAGKEAEELKIRLDEAGRKIKEQEEKIDQLRKQNAAAGRYREGLKRIEDIVSELAAEEPVETKVVDFTKASQDTRYWYDAQVQHLQNFAQANGLTADALLTEIKDVMKYRITRTEKEYKHVFESVAAEVLRSHAS